MRRSRIVWVVVGLCVLGAAARGAAGDGGNPSAPVAVSPGLAAGGVAEVGACPTFSWGRVDGAVGYEVVLYRLSEADATAGEPPRVVGRIAIPGQALSWTPSRGECLRAGGLYGWAVRAVGGEEAGPGPEAPWSEVRLFRVPEAPPVGEVEAALAVLRRYLETAGEGGGAPAAGEEGKSPRRARPAEAAQRPGVPRSLGPTDRSTGTIGSPGAPLGTRAAPAPGIPSLTVSDQIHLDTDSHHFKGGEVFLWDDTSDNLALGRRALSSATGAAAGNTALGGFALSDNTSGDDNTASGRGALRSNTTGSSNTAIGSVALFFNVTGTGNTASGSRALRKNVGGNYNTASGSGALYSNTGGARNTGTGTYALYSNTTGSDNAAHGARALRNNTTGGRNTASGSNALTSNTTGMRNVAIGYRAGFNLGNTVSKPTTSISDNIYIGNEGQVDEEKRIRIGTEGTHTAGTFIQGIDNNAVAGSAVQVDANGQLGVIVSSLRFKEEVEELGDVTPRLLGLRPVTFRYRPELVAGGGNPEVGLIAEEVAEVFPELVIRDEAGEPFGVRYDLLSVLLLEALQEEQERGQRQEELIRRIHARLEQLEGPRP